MRITAAIYFNLSRVNEWIIVHNPGKLYCFNGFVINFYVSSSRCHSIHVLIFTGTTLNEIRLDTAGYKYTWT